jgi:2-methylcitrate dehydratase PrpD
MSTLHDLCRWARELSWDAVPSPVQQGARLQHLSAAGAVRLGQASPLAPAVFAGCAPRGASAVIGSERRLSRRDSVHVHATLAGSLDFGDVVLWASPGQASSIAGWALAGRAPLRELLTATVAANEVAGRIGLAHLLASGAGPDWSGLQSLAAALTASRLLGLDADQTTHAAALALGSGTRLPALNDALRGQQLAQAIQAGLQAAELAQEGVQGPTDLLDRPELLQQLGVPVVLRGAYAGLGSSWISETLLIKRLPVGLYAHAACDALLTVLQRHMRAADKRLRPDQWIDCRIRASWPTWVMAGASNPQGRGWHLPTLFGVLGKGHALGPEQLDPAWLAQEAAAIEPVAATVQVEHWWPHTLRAGLDLMGSLGPLLADVGLPALRNAAHGLGSHGRKAPRPGREELVALLRKRPTDLLSALDGVDAGDLTQVDLSSFRYTAPVDIRLSTTRGGFWPETRMGPDGGPGTSMADRIEHVTAKFAQGSAEHAEKVPNLLLLDDQVDGQAWVDALV